MAFPWPPRARVPLGAGWATPTARSGRRKTIGLAVSGGAGRGRPALDLASQRDTGHQPKSNPHPHSAWMAAYWRGVQSQLCCAVLGVGRWPGGDMRMRERRHPPPPLSLTRVPHAAAAAATGLPTELLGGACLSLAAAPAQWQAARWQSLTPEDAVYAGPSAPSPKRVTLRTLRSKYAAGQPISMVTAYDYPSAVHVRLQ